ncbi:MAG: radical SAM/SPASM domain-containing protein [Anaerolineae bacterium]
MSVSFLPKAASVLRSLLTRRVTFPCDGITYRWENVPPRKLLNWLVTEVSVHLKPSRPWGWPTVGQIEPSTMCNLRCALCPVTQGLGRPQGVMDLALFKRFVDEAGPYLFLLLMWDWGEPFLNPGIYEMIAYAKARGIRLISSTNGHLFAKREHAEQVVRSGLDTLVFAVDGITQETYQKYRRSGDLETALAGMRTVLAVRRELGAATPLVNLRFIVMRHNEHEVPRLKELAPDLGIDVLTFKTLNPDLDPETGLDREEFVPTQERYRRFRYSSDGRRLRLRRNPCRSLWNSVAVHWNGTISACSLDAREVMAFGTLQEASLRDIWFGQGYAQARRQFRRDWERIPFCRDCSSAFAGGCLASDTIAEAVFVEADACGAAASPR